MSLPPAVRSSRGTSLMNFMKVESTGTASWVLFAPVGQGSNLTGFHQETKKRRSFNCGSQDLIVQPLATADNLRYSSPSASLVLVLAKVIA